METAFSLPLLLMWFLQNLRQLASVKYMAAKLLFF